MKIIPLMAVACLAACSDAQSFIDGGFDSGTLNAWTVTPTVDGTTLFKLVNPTDIDGAGALGASNAGDFSVGNATFDIANAGIYLTQSINLMSGSSYTISFNWSAQKTNENPNAQGGIFDLVVDGDSLAHDEAGVTSQNSPRYGFLTADYLATSTGVHEIGVLIQRPYMPVIDGSLHQFVDNFNIVPEPATLLVLGGGLIVTLRCRRK